MNTWTASAIMAHADLDRQAERRMAAGDRVAAGLGCLQKNAD